jgi:hypothetical protein
MVMVTFISFGGANSAVRMSEPELVSFRAGGVATGTSWSWGTPAGGSVQLSGSGLTFDAQLRATAGRISEVRISQNDGGGPTPDVLITGVGAPAAQLDDSADSFWSHVLAGTTIINAQSLGPVSRGGTSEFSVLFGDDRASSTSASGTEISDRGGNDVITIGDGSYLVYGDVQVIDGGINGRFARYDAGDDQILAQASVFQHQLSGDAAVLFTNATLLGGNDLIAFGSRAGVVAGDVMSVLGGSIGRTRVEGGNDRIEGKAGAGGAISGDVSGLSGPGEVIGGDDTITDGDLGDELYGDLDSASGPATGSSSVVGGNDTIFGNGGDDLIAGEIGLRLGNVNVTGGNDLLRGGIGNDRIFGEIAEDRANRDLTGGSDTLFGDAGNDFLVGQAANDTLFGGDGNDELNGGTGGDRLEAGTGNDALEAGSGADRMFGGTGNDVLEGAAGRDEMTGGAGADDFLFNRLGDSGVSSTSRDLIRDFRKAEGDQVALDGFVFGDFDFIGKAAFSRAEQIRFTHVDGTTRIDFNADADAAAEMQILLTGQVNLAESDFGFFFP